MPKSKCQINTKILMTKFENLDFELHLTFELCIF